MSRQVILGRVTVQPVFLVIEDGQVAAEITAPPSLVIGKDWSGYSGEPFTQDYGRVVEQLSEAPEPTDAPEGEVAQ